MQLKQRIFYSSLYMLISPIGGLIRSLKGAKGKAYKKWMLTIFSGIYASTFSIEGIGDGTRHWQNVYDYYVDVSFTQFWLDFYDIITFTSNENVNEDLYIHLLSYFTGNIIGAPAFFFVFVGLVYGYFFSSSLLKLFDRFPNWKKHSGVFILALYFICILNLQSMNTVRTWTGFWVLFYGVLQYLETRRLKYALLMLCAPLFHLGYFAMGIPVWAGIFFRWNKLLVVILFIASFGVDFISPDAAVQQLNQTQVGQEKVDGYLVEDSPEDRAVRRPTSSRPWYLEYRRSSIVPLAIVAIGLIFVLNGDYHKGMNKTEASLFTAGLLTMAFSNSTWFLFAVSNRSGVIAEHLILAALLIYWQRLRDQGSRFVFKPWLNAPWKISLLLTVPVFVYYLSNTIEYLSAYIFAFPFFSWIGESVKITIRELLGILLGID